MGMSIPLAELGPKWITVGTRRGVGVSFRCPHCTARIRVFFCNPIDGGPPALGGGDWVREGANLDHLTVSPRIDIAEHWCGHIVSGEVITLTK